MRKLLAIAAVLLMAASLWGCGGDEATIRAKTPKVRFGTFTDKRGDTKPRFDVSDRSPPKTPLVRDLKVGKGAGARKGDTVLIYYVRAFYKTGMPEYIRWPPQKPLEWKLFGGAAWERKIEGMKVGGRREMLIPSRLAFGNGAFDYMFDLVGVKQPA
jgi:hypothetical protein